jgi:hypothetical protein
MNIKSSCVVFGEKTRESHTDKSSILQSSGWPNIFFWLSINSKILFLKKKTKKNQVFQENPMKNRNKIKSETYTKDVLKKNFLYTMSFFMIQQISPLKQGLHK